MVKNKEQRQMKMVQTQMAHEAERQKSEFENLMRDSGSHIDTPWGDSRSVGRPLSHDDGLVMDEIINGGLK